MREQRPVLRVALVGVVAVLLAFTVTAGDLGWLSHRYTQAQDRATATAQGTVVEDGIGDEGDIRVRWVDQQDNRHEQRFSVYDTDTYAKDRAFDVSYDPAHPGGRAFPRDPEETSEADDLEVPIGLVGLAALGYLGVWGWRGVAFRRGRRRPSRAMHATVLSGEHVSGGAISAGGTTWLALSDTSRGDALVWQRVMWHPALGNTTEGQVVTVHGDIARRRRIQASLADGTDLVSVRRLRHAMPRSVLLEPRADTALEADEMLIIPARAVPPPPAVWWRRPVQFAVVGALLGLLPAMLIAGGGIAILPFVAGFSAVTVNIWALSGAEP